VKMRASRTRELPARQALSVLGEELARNDLSARIFRERAAATSSVRCELLCTKGKLQETASGHGTGIQAEASATFEAWERYSQKKGFDSARFDPDLCRLMLPSEIREQPALADDAMLLRLELDYPTAAIGCLRFEPLFSADSPLWYPAFARFPWCKMYPIPGEDREYSPYYRYATCCGTAAGTSDTEATLHALLEAIEGDATSIALIDWYIDRLSPRLVNTADLPRDLQATYQEISEAIKARPVIFDITADIGIPSYTAVLPTPARLGIGGEGSSLIPGYALERAITELAQCHFLTPDDDSADARLRGRIAKLAQWPILARSALFDVDDLLSRAVSVHHRTQEWWEGPAYTTPAEHLARIESMLSASGFGGYVFRWNPHSPAAPVLTVLVPGLETFFLVRKGIPVLPSGRGMRRLNIGSS
jgi:ribosomal protein S12 methylthiotransferase accessory factor